MANITRSRQVVSGPVQDSSSEIRVALYNGSLTRGLTIGQTWNYLRVGVRLAVDPDYYIGGIFAGRQIFIGVCSDTSSPWNNGATTTTHAVGVLAPSAAQVLLSEPTTGTQGAGSAYWNFKGPIAAKRIGTAVTESATSFFTDFPIHARTDFRTSMIFVDIEKQSSPTDWNIKLIGQTSLPYETHYRKQDFINYMTTPYASFSITGYSKDVRTLPVDEDTYGPLNAVNVFCDCPGYFEIADVAVARFS